MARSDGSARFRLEGEDATGPAFKAALGQAQTTARRMQGIFAGAFASISAAAIIGLGRRAIETGDELAKAGVKAGLAGEQISSLAYAAKLADVDLTSLSTSLRFMQKNLSEANSGSKGAKESLAALGFTIDEIRGLRADEQFEQLADRISKLQSPADRSRAATELFGKAGAQLLPMFEQGAQGIRAAREEAERLGLVFSDEQIAQLSRADDAIKRLDASWQGFWVTLTAKVAPALADNLDALNAAAAGGPARSAYELRVAKENLARAQSSGADDESIGRIRARIKELQNDLGIVGAGRGGRGTSKAEATQVAPPGYHDTAPDKELADLRKAIEKGLDASQKDVADWVQDSMKESIDEFREYQEGLRQIFRKDEFEDPKKYVKEAAIDMGEYVSEAMRGIQGSFANLFKGLDGGVKGLLRSSVTSIRDAFAEIAAAKLAYAMFGKIGGDGIASGGLLSGFVNSMFGGFKAEGGPLQQGKWYVAGERGPEPVWGGGPGAFAMGYGKSGGGDIHVTVAPNVDMRGSTPDAVKLLPSVMRAASDDAVARVRAGLASGRWK